MSEARQQVRVLREGIIGAYPNPDDLSMLLYEEMGVQFDAIARGNTYKSKIFNLIQDFEAKGRLEEFIKAIINDRPNSPHLERVKVEFGSICEKPTKPNKILNPPQDNGEKIFYIDLIETEGNSVLLSYFLDNPDDSISIKRSPSQLNQEIEKSDNPYRTSQILYQWLNGSEKILEIQQETIRTILALALPKTLVQYPWESLNLSNKNLVPIRWLKKIKQFLRQRIEL